MTARVLPDGSEARQAAIAALRAGRLVGLPTDTVYGIAVDLAAPGGIERLFAAKARPPEKGIVLLLADAGQAAEVGVMTPAATALADACWPGGLTLILARRPGVALPEALTGGAPTIGVRVPDHPAPREIAAALGPLPTSSANRSGQPDARSAAAVVEQLGADLAVVVDGGASPGGTPSTVVDASGTAPRILRAGAIGEDRIRALLVAAGVEPVGEG